MNLAEIKKRKNRMIACLASDKIGTVKAVQSPHCPAFFEWYLPLRAKDFCWVGVISPLNYDYIITQFKKYNKLSLPLIFISYFFYLLVRSSKTLFRALEMIKINVIVKSMLFFRQMTTSDSRIAEHDRLRL